MTSGLFAPPSSPMHSSDDAEPSRWTTPRCHCFRGFPGKRLQTLTLLGVSASTHYRTLELLVALALL